MFLFASLVWIRVVTLFVKFSSSISACLSELVHQLGRYWFLHVMLQVQRSKPVISNFLVEEVPRLVDFIKGCESVLRVSITLVML